VTVFGYYGPLVTALVLFSFRIKELGTNRALVPGTVRERWTLRLFFAAGILMITGSVMEFHVRDERLRWPSFVVGCALALGSFGLRRWAIASLGKYWSLHVEIRQDHPLVKSGPFRWMRHPTYLSMIMELMSGALILNAILTSVVVFPIFIAILIYRLRLEEAALIEKFGAAYEQYRREVPALIPCKWPKIIKA
jgi:protein-S-isoprenylcysteine O-methyltransferase